MYKVLANLILKSNDSFLIDEDLSQLINLNPNKQYFMMMYKYGMSAVMANVKEDLIISPNNSWIINSIPITETIIKAPLCCDIDYLIERIQDATNNQMILKINVYGHIELSFDVNVLTINIGASDLAILGTPFLGVFNSAITTTTTITSPKVPVISDFNYCLLTCNLVSNSCFVKVDNNGNNKLNPTTAICSNSAALVPFSYNEWISRTNVVFPITSGNIQHVKIELLDENLNKLTILPGAQTDFNVNFSIVELF